MTAQLDAWKGEFGNAYIERNGVEENYMRDIRRIWSRILHNVRANTILEVGCNIGLNLRVLPDLTGAEVHAIEPNERARGIVLRDNVLPPLRLKEGNAFKIPHADDAFDFVFTSGVLIHIHPNDLEKACREIHRVSSRYIMAMEYFSDQPREVEYRGKSAMMWTRDFGSYWLSVFPDLKVVDYGFFWRGAGYPENTNFWLFEK